MVGVACAGSQKDREFEVILSYTGCLSQPGLQGNKPGPWGHGSVGTVTSGIPTPQDWGGLRQKDEDLEVTTGFRLSLG